MAHQIRYATAAEAAVVALISDPAVYSSRDEASYFPAIACSTARRAMTFTRCARYSALA